MSILPYVPEQNRLIIKHYPKAAKIELSDHLSQQYEHQFEDIKKETGQDYTPEDVESHVGETIRKLYSDMAAGMVKNLNYKQYIMINFF